MRELARSAAREGARRSSPRTPIGRRLQASGLLLLLLLFHPSTSAGSEDHDPPIAIRSERPRFVFDSGAFWRNDSAWVAVEVGVPYRELMFRLAGERYRASFDLIVVLYDGKRQVAGDLWHEEITTDSFSETRGGAKSYRRGVVLPARSGKMRVEVTVSEQESGNEGRLAQEVRVPDLRREPVVLGKIWFAACPSDSVTVDPSIPRDPLVSRRFGAASGKVCAWSQVYSTLLPGEEGIEVRWRIHDDRREVVLQEMVRLPAASRNAPVIFTLPIDHLWLGGYELVLQAKIGGMEVIRSIPFEMDESTVSLEQNPRESIALVRYIAKGEEIEKLERASPKERQRVWDEFWKKRDPTPETEENEFKIEFFRRVRYANENFGGIGPGWRTDRGMIYIQYGPPDQIESHPHNIDGPPYEVWLYNSLRRRFVFVDYDGFGRYELYTPGRR